MDSPLTVIILLIWFPKKKTFLLSFSPVADDSSKYMKTSDGLAIKRVTKNDSGEYTCRAYQISSTLNNVKEQTIRLNVQRKSIILSFIISLEIWLRRMWRVLNACCTQHLECVSSTQLDKPRRLLKSYDYYYGYIKGFVNLTCEAIAEPSANFTWKRHDKLMPPTSGHHQIFTSENQSVLQVSQIFCDEIKKKTIWLPPKNLLSIR